MNAVNLINDSVGWPIGDGKEISVWAFVVLPINYGAIDLLSSR